MITIIVVGIAIAANFTLLKWKYDHGRHNDLIMDVAVLAILSYLFGGTGEGLAAAMVGGMLVSIYLLFTKNGDKSDKEPKTRSKPSKGPDIVW